MDLLHKSAELPMAPQLAHIQLESLHLLRELMQKLYSRIADNGRIINISTGLTRFVLEGFGAYSAMKAPSKS